MVGGGYIGLELGSVYASLGSTVSVVEMTNGLLPGCDRDLVSVLKRRLDAKFAAIRLETKVAKLEEQKNGVAVTFESAKGEQTVETFDKVLISIGRRPNTEELGLENTKIERDERGFVIVDGQRRTAEPHIFAIGDIAGEPMLAHKAYAEAEVAAESAAGRKAVYDPRAIPAVVFTDPEIAWCGLTETEARAQGHQGQDGQAALARQRAHADPRARRRHHEADRRPGDRPPAGHGGGGPGRRRTDRRRRAGDGDGRGRARICGGRSTRIRRCRRRCTTRRRSLCRP